jgi:antitoxin ParD1/3/4
MVTLTFSLSDSMMDWIDSQVGEDGYASASEYLADLILQDQAWQQELGRIADEGLASGVSTRTMDEIFEEAMSNAKARGTYRE